MTQIKMDKVFEYFSKEENSQQTHAKMINIISYQGNSGGQIYLNDFTDSISKCQYERHFILNTPRKNCLESMLLPRKHLEQIHGNKEAAPFFATASIQLPFYRSKCMCGCSSYTQRTVRKPPRQRTFYSTQIVHFFLLLKTKKSVRILMLKNLPIQF
jgi:hypothetical protein